MEFKGSFQDLQTLVQASGTAGHWVDEGTFYKFLTEEGVTLNWWPKTHLMSFQGAPEKKQKLVEALQKLLNIPFHEPRLDLQLVINTWPDLPDSIKFTILDLVHSALK